MPPVSRIIEVSVYSLLNFLPFLALAIYPFRASLRFSKPVTGVLIGFLTLVQLFLGFWAAFYAGKNAGLVSAVSTILYAVFYFLAVKKHFGKTIFTLLMISNLANLAVISAKSIEGQLFPVLAVQSYRWSFSLMLFAVELVISVPLFFYIKYIYTPAVEKEPSGFEWRYLWLIPATFYFMWYYAFYGNVSSTGLEIALRPKNAVFLLFINIGEILIYYVVTRLILDQNKIIELKERNHRLTMQSVQYEILKNKIAEARRAKHDVRHHIAILQNYLQNKDYDALADYIGEYSDTVPDDTSLKFCENSAANAVLLYFSEKAKKCGISYSVKAEIPQNAGVSETDISVMLGNIIENAIEACKSEKSENKQVVIHANTRGGSLCITVDNTFTGELKFNRDGDFVSTKHKGMGLGTKSVKSIVESYGGVCRFETKDGMFFASVLCPARQEKKLP